MVGKREKITIDIKPRLIVIGSLCIMTPGTNWLIFIFNRIPFFAKRKGQIYFIISNKKLTKIIEKWKNRKSLMRK